VHDTFNSWRGLVDTVRATFSARYSDSEALAAVEELSREAKAQANDAERKHA
jgi:hypothetical protein